MELMLNIRMLERAHIKITELACFHYLDMSLLNLNILFPVFEKKIAKYDNELNFNIKPEKGRQNRVK